MEDISSFHDRVCCSAISNDVVKVMSSELLNAEQRVLVCVLLRTVTLHRYMSWVYFTYISILFLEASPAGVSGGGWRESTVY